MSQHLVAIHQPNFFPWLGYFDKIHTADTFVVLDDVQFPKKGGAWINRVKLGDKGAARWLTLPVVRAYHGLRTIREMEIQDALPWRESMIGLLRAYYRKAPFYASVEPALYDCIMYQTASVLEFNMHALGLMLELIGLPHAELAFSSSMPTDSSATERLVHLVRSVQGTAYYCGGGAGGYQEDELFQSAGLELRYQNFTHPVYAQTGNPGDFLPGLSIIDALCNLGPQGVRELFSQTRIQSHA